MEKDLRICPLSPNCGVELSCPEENRALTGEAFSGKGLRRMGEGAGMEEVLSLKAENDWTVRLASEDLRRAWVGTKDVWEVEAEPLRACEEGLWTRIIRYRGEMIGMLCTESERDRERPSRKAS